MNFSIRAALVASSVVAAGLAGSAPALADGGPGWVFAGDYTPGRHCDTAGTNGVKKNLWLDHRCTPRTGGGNLVKLEVHVPPATGEWKFVGVRVCLGDCDGEGREQLHHGWATEWKCVSRGGPISGCSLYARDALV
ncbi:hypothetical protein [Allokutzneria albata]|uniref:Secreted protein n=1 Tax=Allokutzneria albata TaxID=211114 RepID=A0A1G9TSY4_ALLAB|nr:hypothetical protein [Allokutzneria albata]SDM50554.1 hypothetical protein SAMN04489726_1965 [Allokutzneria albata]